jgi:hypothetical protein
MRAVVTSAAASGSVSRKGLGWESVLGVRLAVRS